VTVDRQGAPRGWIESYLAAKNAKDAITEAKSTGIFAPLAYQLKRRVGNAHPTKLKQTVILSPLRLATGTFSE